MTLGEVFGPSAAGKGGASGLAGRLSRVAAPPATPVAQPAAAPVAPPPATPVAQPVASAVVPPVAEQRAGTAASDDSPRQISIYVLPHVPEAIRAAKHGRTNAAVVYDAIEACLAELPALLEARRAVPATQGHGGLFVRQAADTQDDTRVPWTFKVTQANRVVLDDLVARLGANSRSELVSTALENTYPAPAAGEGTLSA